jgi:UDP-N-acetylmuramoylalanine--D-glutamate ligase
MAIAVSTLDEALEWCWNMSRPGDAVVLSPGCSSHDQFRNFRERGERFAELVSRLAKDMP